MGFAKRPIFVEAPSNAINQHYCYQEEREVNPDQL